MTDQQSLLAAILSYPEDDTPRLVYADWCDEHGESDRATLIRFQIEYSRLPPCRTPVPRPDKQGLAACWQWFIRNTYMMGKSRWCDVCQRRDDLIISTTALIKSNFKAWTKGLPKAWVSYECLACNDFSLGTRTDKCQLCNSTGIAQTQDYVKFTRGFISSIITSWSDWYRYANKLTWWPGAVDSLPDWDIRWDASGSPQNVGKIEVLRPVTSIMHPITEVTFTDLPPIFIDPAANPQARAAGFYVRSGISELQKGLSQLWPSVKIWNLPAGDYVRI